MQTLATVLVATALTMAIGSSLGIAGRQQRPGRRPPCGRSSTPPRRCPSFVYLLPALALFGATRFTAIVAALIFAVPPVIRLVEDGIRGVPADGRRRRPRRPAPSAAQLLWKVQLPMARSSLLLAANQGIVLVLAMVVVGGLVGAGALGYDVVAGFSQRCGLRQGPRGRHRHRAAGHHARPHHAGRRPAATRIDA